MAANVNKPTDTKQKELDVNRKLQAYGIISAFQHGKVPSNDQIDIALNSFLNSRALAHPSDKLSNEGKVLVQDAQEVVKQAKYLLLSKNDSNLLQEFIWDTQQFKPSEISTPNAPVSKETAKSDGDDAAQGLKTLGTLLITNGQFRKLLNDATLLLRDMAGDAASNAASKVRPSDQQLSQMDRPADDNTWHDAPDFSKENMKKQAQGFYGGNPKQDAKDVADAGVNAGTHGQQNLQTLENQGVQSFQTPQGTQGYQGHGTQGVDANAGMHAAKNVVKDKIDTNADPQTKDNILERNEEYRRRGKEYFDKKMPQDRKDQTIYRLKKMVLECQQHPDYSQAIQTLLRLAEEYSRHGRQVSQESGGTAKETRGGLHSAEKNLRTLIERFANGTSTEDLWDSIGQIYKDADNDRELKDWFKSTDAFIRRCLLEQGYILDDASTREWDNLYDHGRYLLRDKYRGHTDRVLDEIKFIGDQFDKDPQNDAFAKACQKLFNDLGNDENGKPVFKPHLVKDLTEVIIPAIMENTAYIPVPRIEYTDPQFDAIIENLVLESDNFAPNVCEVSSEHYFRWGRKKIANKNHQTVEVKVAGVQMDLRDVSYHVKRKQGFPSLTDTGVVDILLPGNGFSFKMKVSTAEKKDSQNFFKVQKVDVDVKGLNIKVKQSKHKLLFSLFKPLMLKVLRPALQKAVEKAIKDKCNELDALWFKVKQEADRAKNEAKSDPENAPNIYKRYYNAAQSKAIKGKEKAKAKTEDKKVNMAVTKQDSLFPNIHLPGGISSKATEYKELAQKGERWESPVFSIGSAKKSSDIPAPPKITRKPHEVASLGPRSQDNFQNQAVGNVPQGTNFQNQGYQTQGTNFQNQQGNLQGTRNVPAQGISVDSYQNTGNFQRQGDGQQTYLPYPSGGNNLPAGNGYGNGHMNGNGHHMNGNGLNKIAI